jgi:hypothetical protein
MSTTFSWCRDAIFAEFHAETTRPAFFTTFPVFTAAFAAQFDQFRTSSHMNTFFGTRHATGTWPLIITLTGFTQHEAVAQVDKTVCAPSYYPYDSSCTPTWPSRILGSWCVLAEKYSGRDAALRLLDSCLLRIPTAFLCIADTACQPRILRVPGGIAHIHRYIGRSYSPSSSNSCKV